MSQVHNHDQEHKLLAGFGILGYRSLRSDLQLLGPLRKVNLLAGQNNAGKSNLLRAVERYAGKPGNPGTEHLDTPHGTDERNNIVEFAIALDENDPRITEVIKQASRPDIHTTEIFQKLLGNSSMRLTDDNLVWFRYQYMAAQGSSPTPSNIQVTAILQSFGGQTLSNLSSVLTSHSGGKEGDDARRILSCFRPWENPPRIVTIDAFRQIGGGTAGDHNGTDLIVKLARLQNPDATQQESRERFESVNHFLQIILDDPNAKLEIPFDRNTINIHRNGLVLPLSHLGTGIHQVVILAAAATLLTDHVVCIEEPEVHLHPLLQKKLVHYLQKETTNQYLIATHSAHILDYENSNVFHVQETIDGTTVRLAKTTVEIASICADLGFRPSDLLQANAVIWVEGPSDRIYLQHWIAQYDPDLIEGIHYSIMFYGGSLLNHLSAYDSEVNDFISLRRINRNIAILIDSDKTAANRPINATKRRIRDEFNNPSHPGFAWITEGYTIENYIPVDILSAAVNEVHGSKPDWQGDQWTNPLAAFTPGIKGTPKKVKIARSVCRSWRKEHMDRKLKRHIEETVRFIREANEPVTTAH